MKPCSTWESGRKQVRAGLKHRCTVPKGPVSASPISQQTLNRVFGKAGYPAGKIQIRVFLLRSS